MKVCKLFQQLFFQKVRNEIILISLNLSIFGFLSLQAEVNRETKCISFDWQL